MSEQFQRHMWQCHNTVIESYALAPIWARNSIYSLNLIFLELVHGPRHHFWHLMAQKGEQCRGRTPDTRLSAKRLCTQGFWFLNASGISTKTAFACTSRYANWIVFKLCHSGVRVRKAGKKYKLRCGIEFFFICGSSVVLMRPTSVGLFKLNKLKTTIFEEEEWKTMFWVDGNRE